MMLTLMSIFLGRKNQIRSTVVFHIIFWLKTNKFQKEKFLVQNGKNLIRKFHHIMMGKIKGVLEGGILTFVWESCFFIPEQKQFLQILACKLCQMVVQKYYTRFELAEKLFCLLPSDNQVSVPFPKGPLFFVTLYRLFYFLCPFL
eukprot:TRINITY_DN28667_c0_g1_i2.p5 TRINITY_DN28667_c0_g1~~TRINITY_DN28667_c0_g1_i2.p5  ORF type:complete len:145 (-),score=6.72 TRINITY_DN28667_c0_g1_i2:1077-1511(-)